MRIDLVYGICSVQIISTLLSMAFLIIVKPRKTIMNKYARIILLTYCVTWLFNIWKKKLSSKLLHSHYERKICSINFFILYPHFNWIIFLFTEAFFFKVNFSVILFFNHILFKITMFCSLKSSRNLTYKKQTLIFNRLFFYFTTLIWKKF